MSFVERAQYHVASTIHSKFGWYEAKLVSLLAFTAVFSLTDLVTTSVALSKEGLIEGNSLLLSIARTLGTNVVQAVAVTKIAFISGAVLLLVVGVKSKEVATRRIILVGLVGLVVMLGFVSLNNIYWIVNIV